jgi:hypothetical protein
MQRLKPPKGVAPLGLITAQSLVIHSGVRFSACHVKLSD